MRDATTQGMSAWPIRTGVPPAESSLILHSMQFRSSGLLLLFLLSTLLLFLPWHDATPGAQAKTACDVLSLEQIEAVVGRKMYLRPTRPQPAFQCSYSTADPFDN